MKPVEIIEVGPRDGLQNQRQVVSTPDKIVLIEHLIAAGARRIEVASFVRPDRVPQMADAEAVIAGVPPRPGLTRIGLVLNERGLERALAAGIEEIGFVAIASDTFGLRNQGHTVVASVSAGCAILRRARMAGRRAQVTIGVAFGCPFEGEVAEARVIEIARTLAEAAPDEIAIADTIGVAVPAQVRSMITGLRSAVPKVPLRMHFHDTRNTGIANMLAAYDAGAMRIDASVGGIGGCPFAPGATGNVATEDAVYALERSGIDTGYDLDRLIALAPWLAERLGIKKVPGLLSRAGRFPPNGLTDRRVC